MIAANKEAGSRLAETFFFRNGKTYDRIAAFSTIGLDTWWKHLIMKHIPPDPEYILDQACGTGILTLKIARRYPDCRVTGVDMQPDYIAIARQKAKTLGLANVEFVTGRAEDVVLDDASVDCITSSYLAKYADLDRLIGQAAKMLRPRGVLVMHELTYPSNAVLLSLWKFHMKLLGTYGASRYPEWATAFRELPDVLRETKWLNELQDTLMKYQFVDIKSRRLTFDATALVVARKPG